MAKRREGINDDLRLETQHCQHLTSQETPSLSIAINKQMKISKRV